MVSEGKANSTHSHTYTHVYRASISFAVAFENAQESNTTARFSDTCASSGQNNLANPNSKSTFTVKQCKNVTKQKNVTNRVEYAFKFIAGVGVDPVAAANTHY